MTSSEDGLSELRARIERIESENEHLRRRVSELELQTAQITERVLRNMQICGGCGGE